jgi:hypothetical protein
MGAVRLKKIRMPALLGPEGSLDDSSTRHVQKFAEVKIRKFSICGGKIRKNATKIRLKSGKNADTIRKQKSIIKKS